MNRTFSQYYPYAHVAWCYDAMAAAYSLGAIGRAKRWHLSWVEPGMRVLYLGAGAGQEVALAAARGAAVTCLEPCGAMARRIRKRLNTSSAITSHTRCHTTGPTPAVCEPLNDAHTAALLGSCVAPPTVNRHADRVTIIESSLAPAADGGGFDLVCGHFFFNLFDARAMPGALAMAASHVRPGGRLVIADFAPPRPRNWPRRLLHSAYYRPVNLAGRALGMCALHPIYDYAAPLGRKGFAMDQRAGFACLPGTTAMYETLCVRKKKRGG